MTESEERVLIRAAQQGDEAAFTTLHKAFQPMVMGQAMRSTRQIDEAEEITARIMANAFLAIKARRFRFKSRFGTWLYSIGKNEFFMLLRKKRRSRGYQFISVDDPWQIDNPSRQPFDLEDERRDPRSAIEAEQIIERGMARLSPAHYKAVKLRDLDELEYQEVAATLGMALATAKSHILRGRARLKLIIEEQAKA